jgi:hypothetical protein
LERIAVEKSVSKRKEPQPVTPAAYTLAQFAKLFGKNRSGAYRLEDDNKIRTIHGYGYGCTLVPATEVARILEGGSL